MVVEARLSAPSGRGPGRHAATDPWTGGGRRGRCRRSVDDAGGGRRGGATGAVGMSSVSTIRVVGLAFHLVLRRRRLTHHPHGTRSHGVGLVRKDISGGIRVMTSIRAGMAGARRPCR